MKTKQVTIPSKTVEATFAQYVGMRIKERRKQLRLTHKDVAESCEISKAFLSECESGKSNISLYKMHEVAKVLQCNIDWFVCGWD